MRFVEITDEQKHKISVNLDNVQFVTVREEQHLIEDPSGIVTKDGKKAKKEIPIYTAVIALNGLVINKVFKEEAEAWKYLENSITQA